MWENENETKKKKYQDKADEMLLVYDGRKQRKRSVCVYERGVIGIPWKWTDQSALI